MAGRDLADIARLAADIAARSGRRAEAMYFDATKLDTHASFAAGCAAKCPGELNIFVAVGAMPPQSDIDADPDQLPAVVIANFTGVALILHHLAPYVEAKKSGRIIVLGSVAGDRGQLKNYVYGASKAGLHAYVEGLTARLLLSGVTVTLVKPGPLDTAMTWGSDLRRAASADACAAHCLRAGVKGVEVTYFPFPWRIIMLVVKHLPPWIMKRVKF